jgi:hypothetical protein
MDIPLLPPSKEELARRGLDEHGQPLKKQDSKPKPPKGKPKE